MHEIVHILNGDSINEVFPASISGERIVFREMMMEGPAEAQDLHSLISRRKQYFLETYGVSGEEYEALTSSELSKILRICEDAKVYIWFEYDLFCQANMWCTVNILSRWNPISNIYVVYPGHDNWKGFSACDQDQLIKQYEQAIGLSSDDILYINLLWDYYSSKNWDEMETLVDYYSDALPRQKDIIQAQLDRIPRNGQPGIIHSTICDLILKYGKEDFGNIFRSFTHQMGQYGMGDMQVKRLIEGLNPKT